jgi:hypothetical protein
MKAWHAAGGRLDPMAGGQPGQESGVADGGTGSGSGGGASGAGRRAGGAGVIRCKGLILSCRDSVIRL